MSIKFIAVALVTLIAVTTLVTFQRRAIPESYNTRLERVFAEVNSKSTTWKAATQTRWAQLTKENIQRQLGALKGGPKLPRKIVNEISALPDNFDSRIQWANCASIKEVRDQANCGSCWAFGAAEAMSDRFCIASNQTKQTRISTEDLLDCCSACGDGCNGGYPSAAWQYWRSTGLVSGSGNNDTTFCQPYHLPNCDHHTTGKYGPCPAVGPTPSCKRTCKNTDYPTPYASDKKKASKVYSVSGNTQIQTEILTNGPVEADFDVYEDFLGYKTGVYQHTTGEYLGGHAIKILGWGVENNVPYWIVANSWNEDWGDQGFFKIKRGSDECGIEDDINAGLAIVSDE